ncbi:MAG: DUF2064 domain-containing protein [Pseudomonadota bacterium]|nr:DUF2064 domain-containing protein [Pseudomonadota bacterium]
MLIDPLKPVLVILCKRPILGSGKQRIAVDLGESIALEVSRLLLDIAIEDAEAWQGEIVISPANNADINWAKKIMPSAKIIAQTGEGLGQRINNIDNEVRSLGGKSVLFIGTDSPGLNSNDFKTALEVLKKKSGVFIPANDGGVILLGANTSWPNLHNLRWETKYLHNDIKKLFQLKNRTFQDIKKGFDVDTREDLLLAYEYLVNDNRPARKNLCNWIKYAKIKQVKKISWPPPKNTLSIIIPVYKDYEELTYLLKQIRNFKNKPNEVLVIDGSDDSDINGLCKKNGVRYYKTDPCRGSQLHFGAVLAKSEILWFLHADSELRNDSIKLIIDHLKLGNKSGYFRFKFRGLRTWYKNLLELAINFRTKFGYPYGDQGIFMLQKNYFDAGGFAHENLFEEVSLIKNLRKVCKFRPLDAQIGVSTRRWDQDGWLKRTYRNRLLAIKFTLGVKPKKLASYYTLSNQTREND